MWEAQRRRSPLGYYLDSWDVGQSTNQLSTENHDGLFPNKFLNPLLPPFLAALPQILTVAPPIPHLEQTPIRRQFPFSVFCTSSLVSWYLLWLSLSSNFVKCWFQWWLLCGWSHVIHLDFVLSFWFVNFWNLFISLDSMMFAVLIFLNFLCYRH